MDFFSFTSLKTLALFDFDGTITKKDTLLELARFHAGPLVFYIKIVKLLPWLLSTKLQFIPAIKGKEAFLREFYQGLPVQVFKDTCQKFCDTRLKELIRDKAAAKIKEHLASKHSVAIVSASPVDWIQPWAEGLPVKVLATQLEVKDGKITGKIAGENCNGMEKVKRINEAFDLQSFDEIFAYGDSSGDKPMLELAHHKFYRYF